MKVCVLGNSHVSALKLAWDELAATYSSINIDFFAAKGKSLGGLSVAGDKLVAGKPSLKKSIAYTSGGKESVSVSEYDAFLVYGLTFKPPILDRRLSQAVISDCCIDNYRLSVNGQLAEMVRTISSVPVLAGHAPFPTRLNEKQHPSEAVPYATVLDILNSEFEDDGFAFVPQPEQTIEEEWTTMSAFAVGAPRLVTAEHKVGNVHEEVDGLHMNSEFGKLYIQSFLDRFQSF